MSEEEIKYSIQKVFGRYSICIENGTTVESYFDVQENIIKIIKQLEKENTQLKSDIEELNLIVGIRQKRNLIRKFDKEYDEEDKKKNPNRDYACITPDAEVVYERYYQLKSVLKEIREKLKEHNLYLDYEPWSLYVIEGSILFDLVEIIEKERKKED